MDTENLDVWVMDHLFSAIAHEATLSISQGRLVVARDGEVMIDSPTPDVRIKLRYIPYAFFIRLRADSKTIRVYLKYPSVLNAYQDIMGAKVRLLYQSLINAGAIVG